MQRLCEFKILPSIWLFIQSERWLVLGFCPHTTSAGVFGINLSTLVPMFGSFEGGAQHNEQGNRTNNSIILNFGEAPGIRKAEFGARYTPVSRTELAPRPKRHKSLGTRKPLEQRPVSRLIMTVGFSFLY